MWVLNGERLRKMRARKTREEESNNGEIAQMPFNTSCDEANP